jgi:hypothetical protein
MHTSGNLGASSSLLSSSPEDDSTVTENLNALYFLLIYKGDGDPYPNPAQEKIYYVQYRPCAVIAKVPVTPLPYFVMYRYLVTFL